MRGNIATFLGALLVGLSSVPGYGQTSMSVAVGGRNFMSFLPFTVALEQGYFKKEGLDLKVHDFAGGSRSIEALVGNSVDVALGALEHAIFLHAKGIDIKAVALFTKSYGAVLSLRPELAKKYKSPKDLSGLKIGVTAPGSSMALALDILISKGGLQQSDVPKIAIGGGSGAIAQAKSGKVDGVVLTDPIISILEHDRDMIPVVDTRTEDGMKYLYGGYIAATTVLSTPKVIAEKRPAIRAFSKAIVSALQWMGSATPQQITAIVPPSFYGQHRDLYIESLKRIHGLYSRDGRIEPQIATNSYKVLSQYGKLKEDIDVTKTYDNSLIDGK